MNIIIKSKAPLRISFAGGGTDILSFSSKYGGNVLNSTIDLNTYCIIENLREKRIIFESYDYDLKWVGKSKANLKLDGKMNLHKAVYNKIVREFNNEKNLNIRISTYSDAPPGSGLGSSSSMVVAMIKCYEKLLKLKLSKKRVAQLAYEIERIDCKINGGSQDQYAASFGGFNYLKFMKNNKIIVKPIKMHRNTINDLESYILLYFTGVSRNSGKIINQQNNLILKENIKTINALKEVKNFSKLMEHALVNQKFMLMANLIEKAWKQKKKTSDLIENNFIKKIHEFVLKNGALAAKISGAGGGGYMMIFVKPNEKFKLKKKLNNFSKQGKVYDFHFTKHGAESWLTYKV